MTLPAIRPGAIAAATLAFIVSFDEIDLAIFLADPRAPTLPVTIYSAIQLDVVGGQALGEIVDIWGDTIETTRCGYERGWIGSIRRPFMPIYAGDKIIELVQSVAA